MIWQRFEDDADGEQVVNLLERNLLTLHFAPDRVDALHAARNLVIDGCRLYLVAAQL